MNLQPVFSNRNFTPRASLPWVKFKVNSFSKAAIGGPKSASISATSGDELSLWELIEFLRCPVTIADELGRGAWWGYAAEARVRLNAIEVGVSIDSMRNALKVAYSYVAPGTQTVGQRKTTAWAVDADSVAEYGRKEFISSQRGLSDAAALARRAAILAAYRWPQGPTGVTPQSGDLTPRVRMRSSRARRSLSATLLCRGWWDTLGWEYASWGSVAAIKYTTSAAIEQAVGGASGNQRVMQQVTVAAQAINILQVALTVRKQGSPADNFTVGLYELDGSGNPTGSALATATLAGGSTPATLTRTVFTMSSEVERGAATQFAIQASRSGAANGTNYFVVEVNTALGYSGGALKLYNGSAWAARSPDADLLFEVLVNNNVESTTQIRDLATTYGQFLTGVDVAAASGVYLPSYRDGDTSALAEVAALLESGGASGRRLLTSVDINRRLSVYEEAAMSRSTRYTMDADGNVYLDGQPVDPHLAPVGEWVRVVDVIPGSVDLTKLSDPTLQFIEGVTWSEDKPGKPEYQFRGQPSIDDMFKLGG